MDENLSKRVKNSDTCCGKLMHSLTTSKNGESLKRLTMDAVIDYLSLGIDPDKTTFWVQSDLPQVLELYWILSKFTPMGILERAHSYKDKVAKGISPSRCSFFLSRSYGSGYFVLDRHQFLLERPIPIRVREISHN